MNLKLVLALLAATFGLAALTGCGSGGGGSTTSGGVTRLNTVTSTVSGGTTFGYADGPLATAQFANPVNLVRDAAGNLYVADYNNGAIRKIDTSGNVTTLVKKTGFNLPFGLAITGNTLYVETDEDDSGNHGATFGTVWNVNITTGNATVIVRDVGRPRGLAVLSDGRVVMSDLVNSTISLLNPTNGAITPLAGSKGNAGFQNGSGTNARFSRPYGVAVGLDGALYVCDQTNNCVRRVTLTGDVTTFAGTGVAGFADGDRFSAKFSMPQGISITQGGEMFLTDNGNEAIRVIEPTNQVFTLAGGNGAGYAEGAMAKFEGEEGLCALPSGLGVYVADGTGGNDGDPFNRVRFIAR